MVSFLLKSDLKFVHEIFAEVIDPFAPVAITGIAISGVCTIQCSIPLLMNVRLTKQVLPQITPPGR
jgi:uncharacterized membrane protein